jgi:hypothetical protein
MKAKAPDSDYQRMPFLGKTPNHKPRMTLHYRTGALFTQPAFCKKNERLIGPILTRKRG